MVGEVIMNGRKFEAIVIEVGAIQAKDYKKALIKTLKEAVLSPCLTLEGPEIWDIVDLIEACDPVEKGGEV